MPRGSFVNNIGLEYFNTLSYQENNRGLRRKIMMLLNMWFNCVLISLNMNLEIVRIEYDYTVESYLANCNNLTLLTPFRRAIKQVEQSNRRRQTLEMFARKLMRMLSISIIRRHHRI